MAASLYPRLLRPRLEAALGDTPVVLLNGPRQAGKTTLARKLANGGYFRSSKKSKPPNASSCGAS